MVSNQNIYIIQAYLYYASKGEGSKEGNMAQNKLVMNSQYWVYQ